jgi:ATP dependent DNA ligase domain
MKPQPLIAPPSFLHPPRPTKAIAPSLIGWFESEGYIAQLKKNGTCTVISVDDRGFVTWSTRHNEGHKAWTPTEELTKYFSAFRNSVFVGELLHSKGPSVKNTIYLFDVLVYLGRDLVGTTLTHRLEILKSVIPISKNILLAETYTQNLKGLYDSLSSPLDEGIVLKKPNAVLRDCNREGLNAGWQVKCRKATKNYGF